MPYNPRMGLCGLRFSTLVLASVIGVGPAVQLGAGRAPDAGTAAPSATNGAEACNGLEGLCETKLSETVFACTHNSGASAAYGFFVNKNQEVSITRQLEDGIRCLMLDVTRYRGQSTVCHGPCLVGHVPHHQLLGEIRDFMESRPREVLVILYQDEIAPSELRRDLEEASLWRYVYQGMSADFGTPTLGGLIESDQRLVLFSENILQSQPWLTRLWDVASDTPYAASSLDELSCAVHRGAEGRPFFLMNHWVNNLLDLPSKSHSNVLNAFRALTNRILNCSEARAQVPSFVAVDFYDQGDVVEVVRAQNQRHESTAHLR